MLNDVFQTGSRGENTKKNLLQPHLDLNQRKNKASETGNLLKAAYKTVWHNFARVRLTFAIYG